MVATRAGWVGKREVVELKYDPKLLTAERLLEMSKRCSGECAPAPKGEFRAVEDQKYYLRQSTWRGVPMTEAQACRVHSVMGGRSGRLRDCLSPRQLALGLQLLEESEIDDLYGTPMAASWWKLVEPPPEEPELATAPE